MYGNVYFLPKSEQSLGTDNPIKSLLLIHVICPKSKNKNNLKPSYFLFIYYSITNIKLLIFIVRRKILQFLNKLIKFLLISKYTFEKSKDA